MIRTLLWPLVFSDTAYLQPRQVGRCHVSLNCPKEPCASQQARYITNLTVPEGYYPHLPTPSVEPDTLSRSPSNFEQTLRKRYPPTSQIIGCVTTLFGGESEFPNALASTVMFRAWLVSSIPWFCVIRNLSRDQRLSHPFYHEGPCQLCFLAQLPIQWTLDRKPFPSKDWVRITGWFSSDTWRLSDQPDLRIRGMVNLIQHAAECGCCGRLPETNDSPCKMTQRDGKHESCAELYYLHLVRDNRVRLVFKV